MKIYLISNNEWKLFEIEDFNDIELRKRNIVVGENTRIGEKARIGVNARIVSIINGYKYSANAYFNLTDNKEYIRLGCFIRTIEDWEKDFDNNQNEFPLKSKQWHERKAVYEYLKSWLEIQKL